VEIGRERIWNLAYVNDIVLIARNKEALEDLLGTFGKFLKTMDGMESLCLSRRGA